MDFLKHFEAFRHKYSESAVEMSLSMKESSALLSIKLPSVLQAPLAGFQAPESLDWLTVLGIRVKWTLTFAAQIEALYKSLDI